MSQKFVLRVMILGFALVVMLVLAAAYLGYQGSKNIQSTAQELVREHLVPEGKGSELEQQIEAESELLLNELELILGTCFLLAVGTSVFTVVFTTRTLQRLEWQTEELNRVSWHMIEDQEKVAQRFSHEMHDELGQALTGLKGMAKRWTPEEFATGRKEFVEILDESIRGVRELSQLLRPVILDDFGLDAGLRSLVQRFAERTQIELQFTSNLEGRLSETMETHLFRITQEALTNVARHSGASKAFVRLQEAAGRLTLEIEDNGRGLPRKASTSPSLGMVGMRARARHINGVLTVTDLDTGGVRIRVEAPVKLAEDHASG